MVADMGAIGFLRKLDLTRRRFAGYHEVDLSTVT